jgi:hypothetical protein
MDVDLAEYPNTWALGSHDEHWSGLNPMGETILRRVLVGLLGQVSFVLGRDVDWGNVADALLDVMQPGVSLRLDARARAVRRGVVHVGVREQGQKLRLRERVLGGRRLSSHRTVAHIHLDETPARFDAMTTAPS